MQDQSGDNHTAAVQLAVQLSVCALSPSAACMLHGYHIMMIMAVSVVAQQLHVVNLKH